MLRQTTRGTALKGERLAYFPEAEGYLRTPVYNRYALAAGTALRGPAIVEERESTLVIGPNAAISVDTYGTLVVKLPVTVRQKAA